MGKNLNIAVNELEAGMVVAKEVYTNNMLLVAKNTIITETIISRLKQRLFADKIEIYSTNQGDAEHVDVDNHKSVEGIRESFDILSKNVEGIFNNLELNYKASFEEVKKFVKKIQEELESTSAIIKNVVLTGSGHDCIYRHSVNVAALSAILGAWLGLDENKINLLTYSAILHDYGKTKVDTKILNKVSILTTKEFSAIKKHPVSGYENIKKIQYLDSMVGFGVLMHHERLDGTGYPFGLKDEKIPSFARIIAIADTFDAINSDRIYKMSKKPFEALEIIQKDSLGKLDFEYCKVFLGHIINYYMGEHVLLSNGKICKVVQIDMNDISKPLLLGEDGFVDLKKEKDIVIEELLVLGE